MLNEFLMRHKTNANKFSKFSLKIIVFITLQMNIVVYECASIFTFNVFKTFTILFIILNLTLTSGTILH